LLVFNGCNFYCIRNHEENRFRCCRIIFLLSAVDDDTDDVDNGIDDVNDEFKEQEVCDDDDENDDGDDNDDDDGHDPFFGSLFLSALILLFLLLLVFLLLLLRDVLDDDDDDDDDNELDVIKQQSFMSRDSNESSLSSLSLSFISLLLGGSFSHNNFRSFFVNDNFKFITVWTVNSSENDTLRPRCGFVFGFGCCCCCCCFFLILSWVSLMQHFFMSSLSLSLLKLVISISLRTLVRRSLPYRGLSSLLVTSMQHFFMSSLSLLKLVIAISSRTLVRRSPPYPYCAVSSLLVIFICPSF
jgi:hypothetical protein